VPGRRENGATGTGESDSGGKCDKQGIGLNCRSGFAQRAPMYVGGSFRVKAGTEAWHTGLTHDAWGSSLCSISPDCPPEADQSLRGGDRSSGGGWVLTCKCRHVYQ
jgi:hypothetical protein